MSRAAIVLLFAGAAFAKPAEITEANLPLRVVIRLGGEWVSNCVFGKQPIPPHAGHATPLTNTFGESDPMFARCYLPGHPGTNKPGELLDVFYLDGKKWWTQAYDQAVPSDALERPIVLSEVLRGVRASIPPGDHRLEIVGTLKRAGKSVKLYRGELRYVR